MTNEELRQMIREELEAAKSASGRKITACTKVMDKLEGRVEKVARAAGNHPYKVREAMYTIFKTAFCTRAIHDIPDEKESELQRITETVLGLIEEVQRC